MAGRPIDHRRRAELLDAVVGYATEHGFADLSWRPVATALGISTTTLVHHFGTKERLLEAILGRLRERILAETTGVQPAGVETVVGGSLEPAGVEAVVGGGVESAGVDAVVGGGVEPAGVETAVGGGPSTVREAARVVWERTSDPARAAEFRLFFAVYGQALQAPQEFADFLAHVVADWMSALLDAGADAPAATLVIATIRGLLLDLLTTGDRERVRKAAETFLAGL